MKGKERVRKKKITATKERESAHRGERARERETMMLVSVQSHLAVGNDCTATIAGHEPTIVVAPAQRLNLKQPKR